MGKKLAVIVTTYNNEDIIKITLESILTQDYKEIDIIIADDGSTDKTYEIIEEMQKGNSNIYPIKLPHGERGIARKAAIEKGKSLTPDFIFIIDSDMKFLPGLVKQCIEYFENNPNVGALVIPEIPYSASNNLFTKVKVFERKVLNNAGNDIGKNSIEAARFWRIEEYNKSGGLNPAQIAFEETQPTIRYLDAGGKIKRAVFTGVMHDEKYVTLSNLLKKKSYYFSVMPTTLNTEKNGFIKALQRYYFFRPVLYRPSNLLEYVKHPILFLGMMYMYLLLTLIGVKAVLMSKLSKKNK